MNKEKVIGKTFFLLSLMSFIGKCKINDGFLSLFLYNNNNKE